MKVLLKVFIQCFVLVTFTAAKAQQIALSHLTFSNDFEKNIFNNLSTGNTVSYFDLLFAAQSENGHFKNLPFYKSLEKDISRFARQKSRSNNEKNLYDRLFYRVHRKYLKKYTNYALFGDLLKKGAYDCVSGTAIYGLILEKLGTRFSIRETDFHIFLVVHGKEQDFIYESTDPLEGFISQKHEIQEMLVLYQNNGYISDIAAVGSEQLRTMQPTKVNKSVGLQELAGLQYYNLAVSHFNKQEFQLAYQNILKCHFIYPSSRSDNFLKLLSQTASH
jgi:hypothetical protein